MWRLQKHLLQSTEYELIFVDPVACVYIKNKPENSAIIKKYKAIRIHQKCPCKMKTNTFPFYLYVPSFCINLEFFMWKWVYSADFHRLEYFQDFGDGKLLVGQSNEISEIWKNALEEDPEL